MYWEERRRHSVLTIVPLGLSTYTRGRILLYFAHICTLLRLNGRIFLAACTAGWPRRAS